MNTAIQSVEIYKLFIPLKEPFVISLGTIHDVKNIISPLWVTKIWQAQKTMLPRPGLRPAARNEWNYPAGLTVILK